MDPSPVPLGYLAAVLTTIAFLPQAYDIYRTGDTGALSLLSYTTYSLGLLLWIIFGYLDESGPTYYSAVFSLVIALYITYKIWQTGGRVTSNLAEAILARRTKETKRRK